MSIGDAIFGLIALYILMAFAGMLPSPTFWIMLWLERKKR